MDPLSKYGTGSTIEYYEIRLTETSIPAKATASWPESFWETYGASDDPSFVAPLDIDAELDGPIPSFDA